MRLKLTYPLMLVTALVCVLAGCSQQRFSNLHSDRNVAAGPPTLSPALSIPNAPVSQAAPVENAIQQATYAPRRENVKPVEPNQQPGPLPLTVLYQRAAQRYAAMDSYIYRLRRREVVNGKKQPEELIRVSVLKEPFSVHLKWLGEKGKGRETIFVKGKFNDQMQILLSKDDPFSIFLPRISKAPDDSMVRAHSRHPITETGFGPLIARFGALAAANEKGDTSGGKATYLGQVDRPEFKDKKVEAVHQLLQPGNDPLFPNGGQRWWFFDPQDGLPVLVIAHDPTGEVEYYCHDKIIHPAHLRDNDFDPDRLWKK
ncbi:MAG TPA: DUF1571 domain-containing protein [Gemmataceae bacterium]|nr:DUF1571 domain-containing protein [Gemmataceae bacterium]